MGKWDLPKMVDTSIFGDDFPFFYIIEGDNHVRMDDTFTADELRRVADFMDEQ